MHIDHPLWNGCGLRQQSLVRDDMQMMPRVRHRIEGMRRCDDLTDNERGFIDKLQEWLDNENRKYEV